MNNQEFRAAFKNLSLPEKEFNHIGHVRMAWIYLSDAPISEAIIEFKSDLMAYATALGAPKKYHETITWFYMMLINERRMRHPSSTWPQFLSQNQDLVNKERPILLSYYSTELIKSHLARREPVLPDCLQSARLNPTKE